MDSWAIGGVVFLFVFGGAMLGMLLAAVLPKHHLSTESKEVVRLAMTTIATLSALVIGLLIASAKSSFDRKEGEIRRIASDVALIDKAMALYGPETREIRTLMRDAIVHRVQEIWQDDRAGAVDTKAIRDGQAADVILQKLTELAPSNETQRWLKPAMLQLNMEISKARMLVVMDTQRTIQWPFLVVLVFWLSIIFASFGLFAPRNGTVIAALFFCSLTVAASIYLIVQMDQPYSGLIKISSEPIRAALGQLGQ